MADDRCLNCNQTLRVINYALGERLMHVDRDASLPSVQKGTAWRHCRQRVATLPPTPIDGLTDPRPTPEYEPERRISPVTQDQPHAITSEGDDE